MNEGREEGGSLRKREGLSSRKGEGWSSRKGEGTLYSPFLEISRDGAQRRERGA